MNLKKFTKRLTVIATSLLMAVTNMQLPVRAAGGKLTYGSGTGISYTTHGPALEGNLTSDWNADTPWLYLDGDVVFCVDPSTLAVNGATGYERSDFSYSLKKKMSLAALHGYYEHGRTAEWYMASQFMVWEARGWTVDSTNLSNYESMKKQIQNAIDHHYDKPSFNGDSDYTVNVGETLTLKDSNGVVSEFDIQSVDGVTITKSGDTLKITPTADAPDTIKLSGERYVGESTYDTIVYKTKGNTSQTVSRLEGTDPVFFNVTINVQKYGKLEITKQDEDGTYVPNTSFKVSKNSDMSSPIGTYTTDGNGEVTVNDLMQGTYYVQEVAVPNHLVLDSTVRSVQVHPNQTTEFNARNNWVKGKIKLRKTDSRTGQQVAGATYAIYNDRGQELQRLVTTATGYVESGYLRFGQYTVKEVIAPTGYVLNDQAYNVTVSQNEQRIEVTGTDKPIEGYIQVIKRDKESGKTVVRANTTFSIYKSNDQYVGDIKTNSNGIAKSDLLRYGDYYLVEKTAPNGYTHSDDKLVYKIREEGKTYEAVLQNTRAKGKITLSKEDKVSGKEPLGEATLEGAVYEVRAKENILDPADGSIIYKAGTLIDTLTTDKNGNASTDDQLYLGKYTVKETQPSKGYTLDETEYEVNIAYENQNVSLITKSVTSKERVISQPFSIIKISDNGTGEADNLAGVEFTIKAQKDIDKYGSWEKAPIATNAQGKTAKVLVTDEKGYAESEELPYGTYVVRETKTPADHYTVPDFTVTISEDSRDPQPWRVFNDGKFKAVIAMIKYDAETGRIVRLADTTFKIRDLDTNEYVGYWEWNPLPHYVDEWKTDESGSVMTGDVLEPGEYQVEEIKAPNGYVLNTEPVKFRVTNDGAYETLPDEETPVITVKLSDVSVKGQIKVKKEGEVLVGTHTDDDGNIVFDYEERPLAGAVFEIYAREDIMSADNQGTVIYGKDQLVDTITTGKDGMSTSKVLPLGKYYVKEKTAPDGMVHNDEEKDVELKYKDQETEIVFDETSFTNERQKIEVDVIKKDKETSKPLEGAEFTLYAKEDISSADGKVLVKAGSKIETVTSGKDGKAQFKADLPLSTYEVRETKAPDGYASTSKKYTLDGTYKGQDLAKQTYSYEFQNEITKWDFTKMDITTNVEIPGAKMRVTRKDTGEVIDEWTSTREAHRIKGMLVGKTYILEETLAPKGYLKAESIEFTIKDTGEVQKVEMKDELVKGKITVEKNGEVLVNAVKDKSSAGNYHFQYENRPLPGMVFEVRAAENIKHPDGVSKNFYRKGELVATLTTGKDGTATTEELPLGKYTVTEVKAPEGFILNGQTQEAELVYKDQYTALVFDSATITNERQKVDLSVVKKDADTDEPLSGAVFGLYAKKDIVNADGKVLVNADQRVYAADSDDKGIAKFDVDLPLAEYYVKEIKAPIGYSSSDEVVDFDATYKGQDVKVIELSSDFKNEITKVEVSKKDITNDEEIEGAHMMVYPKGRPGEVFETWISGQDGKNEDGTIKPHLIKGLETNVDYILKETSSPYGYAIAKEVEFTVKDTGEVQSVEMKDEMVFGQLEWNKSGEIFMQTVTGQTEFGETQSPVWEASNILGAEITIYAAEDITIGNHTYYHEGEAVQTLESDWETVVSKKLPVGRYYYRETKVPHGYIVDTERHYFEVEDNQKNELQKIESTLENERPTVDIDMTKVLEEQEVFKNPDAYKDIVFGIFAREDIYNYMGEVAIPYDTLVYTSGIDKDGNLTLADTFDLPNGVYYVKELATNGQYVLNDNEYDFEIAYHGEDVSNYVVQIGNEGKIDNELARGSIEVQKVDTLDADKKLEGIEFNISVNEDMSEILSTAKTDKDGIARFNDLELGTYYIKEAKQVDGYTVNDHIYKVEVNADGDLLTITCENKPTEMEFSKVGETGSEELEGAKIQVIDKETGDVVDEWVSGKDAHIIHYLVEGKKYIMKEITAPYGYEIAEEIEFTAGDGDKVTMKDKMIRVAVEVNKVDSVTKENIKSKDFEFTMYSDEECKNPIAVVKGDTETGVARFDDVTYGTYYIKETKAPKGYKLSDEVKKVVIDENTPIVDGVYSFEYVNVLLPVIKVNSGITENTMALVGIFAISGIAVVFVSRKRRKAK